MVFTSLRAAAFADQSVRIAISNIEIAFLMRNIKSGLTVVIATDREAISVRS